MLFSLLLDDDDNIDNALPKLWNIFHDLYINDDAMTVIHAQSKILMGLMDTMDSWKNSRYSKVLQIVNEETLSSLRSIFTSYANSLVSKTKLFQKSRVAMDQVYRKYYCDDFPPKLTRSFGVLAPASVGIANSHTQEFWGSGYSDINDFDRSPLYNPLFAYSSAAGDTFTVHLETNPLAAYHLSAVFPDLTSETPFPEGPDRFLDHIRPVSKRVLMAAKMQFTNWCLAFQQFVKNDGDVIIRVIVAEPLAFCFALQQRTSSPIIASSVIFSGPWSSMPLYLNDLRDLPAEFNVIDTSTLMDDVSIFDILIATTPLLEKSPVSSIFTHTVSRPWSQETELLPQIFCLGVTLLCAMLGIAPLSYLTGITTRGLSQDLPTVLDFSGERSSPVHHPIVWKFPASGDSEIDLKQSEMSCDSQELTAVLISLFREMLDNRPKPRGNGTSSTSQPNNYTVSSFVSLVAFLKRRLIVEWDLTLKSVVDHIRVQIPVGRPRSADLEIQLYQAGLYISDKFDVGVLELSRPLRTKYRVPTHGVLSSKPPPPVTCIVFTVPRERLRHIYENCMIDMHEHSCVFQLRFHRSPEYSIYSNLLPIFGSLTTTADRRNGRIKRDTAGWHGSSDLHVCVYVPTSVILADKVSHISLNVIVGSAATATALCSHYGPDLEIFRFNLDDVSKVQLLESVPGCEIPNPLTIPNLVQSTSDTTNISTIVPKLLIDCETAFSTRVTLTSNVNGPVLSDNTKISAIQTSPCVITLTAGETKYRCRFPFPVNGKSTKLRVARKSGWIEVVVELSDPKSPNGGYTTAPWPVIKEATTGLLCNWNTPWVNFDNLPLIELQSFPGWYDSHLEDMYSDRERKRRLNSSEPLINFKTTLIDLFRCLAFPSDSSIPVRFGIQQGDVLLLFFITRLFLDPSLHNIVAETYVVESKPHTRIAKLVKNVDFMIPTNNSEMARFWFMAVPAMIERCRDWEHQTECEYKTPASASSVLICSCGMGKIGREFLNVEEWAPLGPYVTRCAISPVFSEPIIEQTRGHWLTTFGSGLGMSRREMEVIAHRTETTPPDKSCHWCRRHEKTRKCGRCKRVYYCGKECQVKDWKQHKRSCRHSSDNQ